MKVSCLTMQRGNKCSKILHHKVESALFETTKEIHSAPLWLRQIHDTGSQQFHHHLVCRGELHENQCSFQLNALTFKNCIERMNLLLHCHDCCKCNGFAPMHRQTHQDTEFNQKFKYCIKFGVWGDRMKKKVSCLTRQRGSKCRKNASLQSRKCTI